MIREYNEQDIQQMIEIWNEVVEEGIAFFRRRFSSIQNQSGVVLTPRNRRQKNQKVIIIKAGD